MTEAEIRIDIKAQLSTLLRGLSEAVVVEEMGICAGKARADIAIISDVLIGIEIKGPQDTLTRLPGQVTYYSKCFDKAVLVVDELHASNALELIPAWWGVVVSSTESGNKSYQLMRQPDINVDVDLDSVLSLLWRPELEELFGQILKQPPSQRASKQRMREQLIEGTAPQMLKSAGLELLRHRRDWRSEQI